MAGPRFLKGHMLGNSFAARGLRTTTRRGLDNHVAVRGRTAWTTFPPFAVYQTCQHHTGRDTSKHLPPRHDTTAHSLQREAMNMNGT